MEDGITAIVVERSALSARRGHDTAIARLKTRQPTRKKAEDGVGMPASNSERCRG